VASVTSEKPITADAILFFTDFVVMVHLLGVPRSTPVPARPATTPRASPRQLGTRTFSIHSGGEKGTLPAA
jgi:hypothetical protein